MFGLGRVLVPEEHPQSGEHDNRAADACEAADDARDKTDNQRQHRRENS